MNHSYRSAPQQKRSWLLYGDGLPRNCAAVEIRGPLDIDRLWSAVEAVVARHEALRATLRLHSGQRFPLVDIESQAVVPRMAAHRSEWDSLVRSVSDGPACFRLVDTGLDCHELWIDVSAALGDAWSFVYLATELEAQYNGSPTEEPLIQYSQFASWQNQLWDEEERQFPLAQSAMSRHAAFGWQPVHVENLPEPESWLTASWQALLARRSNEGSVTLGQVHPIRPYDELQSCVGQLACVIPTHVSLRGHDRFDEWIAAVRSRLAEPVEHTSHLITDSSYMEYGLRFTRSSSKGNWRLTKLRDHVDRFDIQLSAIWSDAGPIEVGLQFDEQRIPSELTANFAEELEVITNEVLRNQHHMVASLPILGPRERQKLLTAAGSTSAAIEQRSLLELVADTIRSRPDAIAVEDDEIQLTYRFLDRYSDELARAMRARGVRPGMFVGLCLEPSVAAIAAIFAVWKAGAAYLILEPRLPKTRLQEMVQIAHVRVILCEAETAARVPKVESILRIDDMEQHGGPVPQSAQTDLHAAYAVFTSGSTGTPKAVVVEHRQISAYIRSAIARLKFRPSDRHALVSTMAADLGLTTLFGSLASGGRLRIVPWMRTFDAQNLSRDMAEHGVDVLKIVPSHLQSLLDLASDPRHLIPRRCLILGGEQASGSLIDRVRDLAPACQIWNHYGPTEATVGTVCGPVEPSDVGPPPLGLPLDGQRVYVLDEAGELVPEGVVGELFVGGAGISRGYLHSPAATAERFLPDPFGTKGSRLYRTGDRVRWLPTGRLAFLGRNDEQVKIRGHRVELREIAAVLRAQPGVADAVVRAVGRASGDRRIVAYIAPDMSYHAARMESLAGEAVAGWTSVFADTYANLELGYGTELQTDGWNSSYTGLPIPEEEIRASVDATLERIRRFPPRIILEVGCGQGLLLFPLAREAERYVATDISPAALKYDRTMLDSFGDVARRVELRCQAAHDTSGLEANSFDLVILNSVIQYFPSAEYLLTVLTGLLPLVSQGGRLFVGDVRSLRHLEAFHAGVQLERSKKRISSAQLAELVARQSASESELVIDPDFFFALPSTMNGLCEVEVHLKSGKHRNELTGFRYDVILHAGPARASTTAVPWSEWSDGWGLARLESCLANGEGIVAVAGIPNARVLRDVQLANFLRLPDPPPTVEGVLQKIQGAGAAGIDPAAIEELAKLYGYHCRLGWAPLGQEDAFEAVLSREPIASIGPSNVARARSLVQCSNSPHLQRLALRFVPQLEKVLGERLPDFMHPSAYSLVPGIPITSNGKVDLTALPVPPRRHYVRDQRPVKPRSATEARVAESFSEVLQIDGFGVQDDFFELGGHSLSATQVVARLNRVFGIELRLRSFFDGPATVERIAKLLSVETSALPDMPIEREANKIAPVSRAQERYLLQGDPSHPVYNIPFAFYLSGDLNVDALKKSLDEIVRRHPVWNAVFEWNGSHHQQRIMDDMAFRLRETDLGELPADLQSQAARRIAQDEALARFDLMTQPAVRGTLIRLSNSLHALTLVVHHIVSDGWSTGIFCRELSALYSAVTAGRPSPLPELTIQYADYARWQRNTQDGAVLMKQVEYWSRRLRNRSLELALPINRPRPNAQTWHGAGIDVRLKRELAVSVRQFARDQDAPVFVVLLSAFKALLFGVTDGQTDIGIGTPVANRTRVEFEQLLGCFINFLVLQTDLSGNPTFLEILQRVRTTCLEAYENQDAPFQTVVEEVLRGHDNARPPLFQVMFELANQPGSRSLRLSGLELSNLEFEHGTSEFELNLILQDAAPQHEGSRGEAGMFTGWFLYRTDLFSEETIRSLFANYESLLEAAVGQPRTRLSDLAAVVGRRDAEAQPN